VSSIFVPPPTQTIFNQVAWDAGVEINVLRLDLIHPLISGNKWFKLKYNLLEAQQKNITTLFTFGGAYSNHIYATAAVGNIFGLRTIGAIRGEQTLPLNPTLSFAISQGMELMYLDRETYRQRHTKALQEELQERFGEVFVIPEGGNNLNGVRGCTEINEWLEEFDIICLACGTGTTLAGITLSLNEKQRVIGFPVLKNGDFLKPEISSLLTEYLSSDLPIPGEKFGSWELVCDYHGGGYAKVNQELINFKQEFEQSCGIPLDYVYTAKMFYGVMDLLQQGFFRQGERLLLLHTGGLQGNSGVTSKNAPTPLQPHTPNS
jgi:1-aminocyclopropane-1-carboxylate deaminase